MKNPVKEQVYTPAISLYTPRTRYEFPAEKSNASRIPEVRTSIRGQIKLLNSIIGVVWMVGLMALCAVIYSWTALADTVSGSMKLTLFLFGLTIIALVCFIHYLMKVSLGEITEQVKKLNGEGWL